MEKLLNEAQSAWLALAPARRRRERLKAFTYGRQWGDSVRTPDGRFISEEQRMAEEGRVPVTNNIIRQTVKSIIGRYRHMLTPQEAEGADTLRQALDSPLTETDARALEEFLISGMAIQRVEPGAEPRNVSPMRFFHQRFERPDGSDCRLLGMLHDLGEAELLERFADGDPRTARSLRGMLRRGSECASAGLFGLGLKGESFAAPAREGTFRIIEVWKLTTRQALEVEDPGAPGMPRAEPLEALGRIEGENMRRAERGLEPLFVRHHATELWQRAWLTPAGEALEVRDMPPGTTPPFVLCFYPMIDGEVHSLVEDVVHQQKYVNRLISLLDHIISSSAKGVLLYPADQLPEGFTWRDIRRIWANPNGILPYKRTKSGLSPEQVNSQGQGSAAASDMLRVQLQLFDQISGATGAVRGASQTAGGEGMLRAETQNALVSMLDILACFRAFTLRRDAILKP